MSHETYVVQVVENVQQIQIVGDDDDDIVTFVEEIDTEIIEILDRGLIGPAGPTGGGTVAYLHTQSVASAVWTIDHNLGHIPVVSLRDSVGDEMDAFIANPTVNRTTISFSQAQTGTARLV